jgi:hypothetical protein
MQTARGGKVYPPVGACIYCRTTEGQLTKEQIIPLGLGGNWILPRASCKRCAAITSDVEQFCLRPMLGPFRIRLVLPTRRPKKRPSELPIEFIQPGGQRKRRSVPVEEFPATCLGFRWPAPGLIRLQPPSENFEGELVARFINEELRKHATPDGQKVKLGSINMLLFARMLAKIGHSYAVADLGLSMFRPLLPDFILGKSSAAPWLVGGDASSQAPDTEPRLHHVYRNSVLSRVSNTFWLRSACSLSLECLDITLWLVK